MDQASGVASAATTSQQPPPATAQQDDDGRDDPNRKRANVRKRTKTGCLTCRRRRIKCDEGRPICNNCIKSKRQCEGYSQRVIFKDPMGAIQGGPFGPALYPSGSAHLGQMQGKNPSQGPLPVIAPKPPSLSYQGHENTTYGHYTHTQHGQPVYELNSGQPVQLPYTQANTSVSPQTTAGYVKIEHDPRSHHFGPPPNGQVGNSYSTSRPPTTTDGPDEAQEEYIDAQFLDDDSLDEDAEMGESDDESRDPQEILGPMVKQFNGSWDVDGTQVRAFSSFAKCNVLSEYTASAQTSELKDARILAIFMHFIQVTGPSMSLYERHPFDHGCDDAYDTTPRGSNNLWSYTFPIIAFNHPALLHAILALASLQIAKLQKIPATAAMKHYHLAIRRIAKNVNKPLRRTQPPTLAATLLLAYFEVWSSDHNKWCNHLFGARILLREMPLKRMSRRCLPIKRLAQRRKDAEDQNQMNSFFPGYNVNPLSKLLDLDYELLQKLSGLNVIAEDYCLGEDQPLDPGSHLTSEKDIEQYENLRDLYWWYCKMDVYQSMLGGTKLFMEYEHWAQCPPRGPISRLDAIYGTYDHLMLLLGRVTDFSSKDVARKRRASQNRAPPPGAPSPPAFVGIMPTTGKFKVPMGFSPPRESSPQSESSDDQDPDISFHIAVQQWESIKEGFEAFEKSLGPEFQPLRPEYSDRRDSPFGMTLQYRTFSVAGIWMNFYMGMIHLYRTHPSMAPAAMQAAGMAAHQTGAYSNKLGRIAAGLSDDCSQVTEISTLVSAAFIESCFCLFVAAIEYREDAQRQWVVRRLRDISRLTGWQSARQIADGCESGWVKAAEIGRGPPYVRVKEVGVPISVWNDTRRIARKIRELDQGDGEERRLVLAKSERASYALGLLGVEHDLQFLELKDEMVVVPQEGERSIGIDNVI
ncbi:hypothetical protein BGZ61DRAFT_472277 [Ilyonectria robusta]|uniref:uncharacterized protein n=1 Tax=Ilyonectria robusta TaxID=1079257 RepID=UPI001E8E365C|nr:uncharacterized protein BGZ61DRAFT_472277 [Ilyonectria robusta]KAH8735896.1 hypothetical protein BGZ61DRAFT_472277 [Ilyonectria robusta]